jgi:hypothetical protein
MLGIATKADTTRVSSFEARLGWCAMDEFAHYPMCTEHSPIEFDGAISVFEH